MKLYDKCEICSRYDYAEEHKCPPVFKVWRTDGFGDIEDAVEIYADNVKEAAILFCSHRDPDDYDAGEDFEDGINLRVINPDGNLYDIWIEAEPGIHYSPCEPIMVE